MKKIILCLSLMIAMLLPAAVFAEGGAVSGVYAMKGRLFYYNTPTDKIVITGVKPVAESEEAKEAAKSVEYNEVRVVTSGMFFKDQNHLAPEWVNNYADREVWFVVSMTEDGGISVPYLVLDV